MCFCHEKGHWKKDCPKLQHKEKAASSACAVEGKNDDSDFVLISSSAMFLADEWIFDSTCTFHMSPNKEWFLNFQELDDGVECNILGIGSIHLKNQDGSTKVLTNIRYVLDVKKNLISLGLLESKSFTFSMQATKLKVISGTLVAMKGIRKNNLYYYQRSTIIGSVVTIVSDEDKDLEITKLSHMRLEHVGEKTSQVLVKQSLLKGAKSGEVNSDGTPKQVEYTTQHVVDEECVCYKATLVAKDYTQKEKIDYNDVFSLVMKRVSIGILLTQVMMSIKFKKSLNLISILRNREFLEFLGVSVSCMMQLIIGVVRE